MWRKLRLPRTEVAATFLNGTSVKLLSQSKRQQLREILHCSRNPGLTPSKTTAISPIGSTKTTTRTAQGEIRHQRSINHIQSLRSMNILSKRTLVTKKTSTGSMSTPKQTLKIKVETRLHGPLLPRTITKLLIFLGCPNLITNSPSIRSMPKRTQILQLSSQHLPELERKNSLRVGVSKKSRPVKTTNSKTSRQI